MGSLDTIPFIADPDMREQVIGFCATLETHIRHVRSPEPPLYAEMDDEEVHLEWISEDVRFGLRFLPDGSESGWGRPGRNRMVAYRNAVGVLTEDSTSSSILSPIELRVVLDHLRFRRRIC